VVIPLSTWSGAARPILDRAEWSPAGRRLLRCPMEPVTETVVGRSTWKDPADEGALPRRINQLVRRKGALRAAPTRTNIYVRFDKQIEVSAAIWWVSTSLKTSFVRIDGVPAAAGGDAIRFGARGRPPTAHPPSDKSRRNFARPAISTLFIRVVPNRFCRPRKCGSGAQLKRSLSDPLALAQRTTHSVLR